MNVPIGTVIAFAGDARVLSDKLQLQGWLICDGTPVSRLEYKLLFSVIGTIHGQGDGSTTFNLPDYRGIFLRGVDEGKNRDPDKASRVPANPGGLAGNRVGSIQPFATARPVNTAFSTDNPGSHQHYHEFNWKGEKGAPSCTLVMPDVNTTYYPGDGHKMCQGALTAEQGAHTHNINGGGDNESRPINAYVFYLINYQ